LSNPSLSTQPLSYTISADGLRTIILMANSTPKTKQHIQTTKQIALRLIAKIRHSENPLHKPSNKLLYERTQMTRISENYYKSKQNGKTTDLTGQY